MLDVRRGPLTWRPFRTALTLALALVAGALLVGPAFATLLAAAPLQVAIPIAVMRVRTFENLGERGCFSAPPLHAGPSFTSGAPGAGRLLRGRIESAMWRCLDGWQGDMALFVEVDRAGNFVEVVADTADRWMQVCVVAKIIAEGPLEQNGPARLNASYFMRVDKQGTLTSSPAAPPILGPQEDETPNHQR